MTSLVPKVAVAVATAIGLVFAAAGPAAAHTVTATVFTVPPVCTPTCSDARTVLFRASVRIDSCNVAQCFVPIQATVWAQIQDGGWESARPAKTNIKVLEVGRRINVSITFSCGGMAGVTHRFRTRSYGEAVGGHTFIAKTSNPNSEWTG
jgi:hypothetical protein